MFFHMSALPVLSIFLEDFYIYCYLGNFSLESNNQNSAPYSSVLANLSPVSGARKWKFPYF